MWTGKPLEDYVLRVLVSDVGDVEDQVVAAVLAATRRVSGSRTAKLLRARISGNPRYLGAAVSAVVVRRRPTGHLRPNTYVNATVTAGWISPSAEVSPNSFGEEGIDHASVEPRF